MISFSGHHIHFPSIHFNLCVGTVRCLRPEVNKPILLLPIDGASPCLRHLRYFWRPETGTTCVDWSQQSSYDNQYILRNYDILFWKRKLHAIKIDLSNSVNSQVSGQKWRPRVKNRGCAGWSSLSYTSRSCHRYKNKAIPATGRGGP
jgi:hypothetical protein